MFALILALAAAAPAQTDQLAQFKAGKILCAEPDVAAKTCANIDRLTVNADGGMTETSELTIVPGQPITLEVTSPVHAEGDALCTIMDLADLRKGVVRYAGQPLPADRNAMVLEKLAEALKPIAGHKACETLHIDKGILIDQGHIEGMDKQSPPNPARWVSPDEGYRVAPSPSAAAPEPTPQPKS